MTASTVLDGRRVEHGEEGATAEAGRPWKEDPEYEVLPSGRPEDDVGGSGRETEADALDRTTAEETSILIVIGCVRC